MKNGAIINRVYRLFEGMDDSGTNLIVFLADAVDLLILVSRGQARSAKGK